MSKATTFVTSFNAGELSRRMDARIDIAKYFSGCRIAENVILRVEGGASKRPGSYYVNEAKYSDKTTILRRFVFSADQAYILEFGDYYIRFYTDNGRIVSGGLPVEVVTPYKYTELRSLRLDQSADILYITHKNHAPRKLERTSHIDWTLTKIPFTASEQETTQSHISVTAAVASSGLIKITTGIPHGFVTGDRVTLENVGGTVEADGTWTITVVDVSNFTLVGSTWLNAWTSGGTVVKEIGYWITSVTYLGTLIKIEVKSHGLETGDMVTLADIVGTTEANGTWIITKIDVDKFTLQGSTFANSWTSGGYMVKNPFKHYDITACANNGSGLIRVTTKASHSFTTGNRVAIELVEGCVEANGAWVITKIDATNFDLQGSVFANAWTAGGFTSNMWPAAVSFYEQRLSFGGTYEKPLTVYSSKSGDYYNMTEGSLDDNALNYSLLSDTVGKIVWLAPEDYLMVGATDSEWRYGGNSKTDPITPTSINAKRQASNGSADIQALLVGSAVLFVQAGGRRIRELAFSLEQDKYTTPDMTRLAYHITESGIVDMTPQTLPDPIVWCTRADGQIATFVYNRAEDVLGWARQITGNNSSGRIESIAIIPTETGEENQIWFSTIRIINGYEQRYIEYLMPLDFGNDVKDAFFVDCGLTFDGGDKTGITAATVANPVSITVVDPTNLSNGCKVRITGCFGMTEINDNIYKVAGLSGSTFHLDDDAGANIDGSAFTAFSANKTIAKCYEGTDRVIRIKILSHGFSTDDEVNIFGVEGCTEANGIWTITVIDVDNFDLVDSKYVNRYISGGTIGGCIEVVSDYFAGLEHLEGEEVAICADGGAEPFDTVSGGIIETADYFNKVHIGLPIRMRLQPMKPDIGGRYGTSQGVSKRIEKVVGRFEKSLDCNIGRDEFNLVEFPLSEDGLMFTGDVELPFDGDYDSDGLMLIESEKPLPLNILGMVIFAYGYEGV